LKKNLLSLSVIVFVAACNDEPPIRDFGFEPGFVDPGTMPGFGTQLGQGLPVVKSALAVEPITGGTVRALSDNLGIVIADPDRSRIVIYDRDSRQMRSLPVPTGSQPFRVVEHAGLVSVVLRKTGEVATFDPHSTDAPTRRAVCAMPRGIDYDASADRLIVACAGGELVTLLGPSGEASVAARLPTDLRDVVVSGDIVTVTRLRSTDAIQLSRLDFSRLSTVRPQPRTRGPVVIAEPTVAWRTVAGPSGGTVMVHQFAQTLPVEPSPGGYGASVDPCGGSGIVTNAISFLTAGGVRTLPIQAHGIPFDVAVDSAGQRAAFVLQDPVGQRVFTIALSTVTDAPEGEDPGCNGMFGGGFGGQQLEPENIQPTGVITSVAITPDGAVAAFQSEPAVLFIDGRTVNLGGGSVYDTGREAFHTVTSAGLACASCHAEGGDDGHTWDFSGMGARRTQNLAGGIQDSAPFHWSGDMPDFGFLVQEVMMGRMQGPQLGTDEIDALKGFIDSVPQYIPSVADAAAAQRGRDIFFGSSANCASCHGGTALGHIQQAFDVGTGGQFQVPSLKGVAFRGPFLHNGCATTLQQRFDRTCGGGDLHGRTEQLSASEIDDLVAFLESN